MSYIAWSWVKIWHSIIFLLRNILFFYTTYIHFHIHKVLNRNTWQSNFVVCTVQKCQARVFCSFSSLTITSPFCSNFGKPTEMSILDPSLLSFWFLVILGGGARQPHAAPPAFPQSSQTRAPLLPKQQPMAPSALQWAEPHVGANHFRGKTVFPFHVLMQQNNQCIFYKDRSN